MFSSLAAAWEVWRPRGRCKTRLCGHAAHTRLEPSGQQQYRAQGGIIYRAKGESPEQLVADILSAGAGLSSPAAASLLSREGPRLVKEILIDEIRVPFDPSPRIPENST